MPKVIYIAHALNRTYLCRVIVANLLLFSIETNTLGNHRIAATTPYIIRHLKPVKKKKKKRKYENFNRSESTLLPIQKKRKKSKAYDRSTECTSGRWKHLASPKWLYIYIYYLMIRIPSPIFFALSLRGCWPWNLFKEPWSGVHSGG